MIPTLNGNGNATKLVWLIMSAACTLVVALGMTLVNDIRNTQIRQAADIAALQAAVAGSTEALNDIRKDIHDLVEQEQRDHGR